MKKCRPLHKLYDQNSLDRYSEFHPYFMLFPEKSNILIIYHRILTMVRKCNLKNALQKQPSNLYNLKATKIITVVTHH